MNKKLFFLYLLVSFGLLSGCTKKEIEIATPLTIQTPLPFGTNEIKQVFALPDNSFVIITEVTQNAGKVSMLYKYDHEMHFTDSLKLDGHSYSKPVFEPDNSFVMIGFNKDYTIAAVKVSNALDLITKKNIDNLFYNPAGLGVWPSKICRLSNDDYVVATTFDNEDKSRLILFCVNDIFTSTAVKWRVFPTNSDGKFLVDIYPTEKGEFIVTSNDFKFLLYNYITKYDSLGNINRENYTPFRTGFTPLPLHIEKDRYIFNDYQELHIFDNSGILSGSQFLNYTSSNPSAPVWENIIPSSPLIKKGNAYFYTCDFSNSDGKFIQVRKTDHSLNVIKTKNFGNRASEFIFYPRFLVELSSGDMILMALVRNPARKGNHWLLLKFNEELELIK